MLAQVLIYDSSTRKQKKQITRFQETVREPTLKLFFLFSFPFDVAAYVHICYSIIITFCFLRKAYGGVFRADGRALAAGCGSGVVQLFDVGSRTVLRQFKVRLWESLS